MVSLKAESVGLTYPISRKFSLAAPDRRLESVGGQIGSDNSGQHVEALRDVSFELGEGDRLGLIGRNGSGKTTLLKVLYGIYKPTTGRVISNGRIDALFNIRLGFRVEATGRRNILLRGLVTGRTKSEIEERTDEIIAFSELGDFIDLPLKSYSQGMAARLAFAIATSFTPEILLLDEWIGAGDPEFQKKARLRMREMADRAGILVLASHNQEIIKDNCNKFLKLDKGKVVEFKRL